MLSMSTEICAKLQQSDRDLQKLPRCSHLGEEGVIIGEPVHLLDVATRLADVQDRLDVGVHEPAEVQPSAVGNTSIREQDTYLSW